ncbi:MAG: hypothetical protein K2P58_12455 [Hyphomonadaceae bacterium]|nr:hypothetical protein [Hyphomonadaceae bacterium]
MKLRSAFVGAFLAAAAFATPAMAWTQVGVRDVRDRTEHDTIAVQGPRQFERIKLCVYRNPVHFYDLDVRFRNGGRQDVSVRARIAPGQCTRAIDLVGDDRNITSISMTYEETSFRRRTATVRVFAE